MSFHWSFFFNYSFVSSLILSALSCFPPGGLQMADCLLAGPLQLLIALHVFRSLSRQAWENF